MLSLCGLTDSSLPQYDKNQRQTDRILGWLPLKLYIMKNLISLGVFLLILLSVQVNAQEQSVLKIRPTGRILMDGGLFHSDNKKLCRWCSDS
mgnify:CR=1 FL=1